MLPLLFLASLPLALANPVADPVPFPGPASPTPLARVPRGISAPLSHGQGYIKRAKAVEKVKRESTRSSKHRGRRHNGSGFDSRSGGLEDRDEDGLPASWLLWAGARVDTKYNSGKGGFASAYAKELTKRANGEIALTDHNLDTSYSASLSVGTPAQTLDIVLDTGSSDLWVASNACSTSACGSMSTYDSSSSSTSSNLTSSFSIEYGSGEAAGNLVQDLVTLGGYSVASQTFASCDSVSPGLLSSGVSGIMGLSWQALAYSKATPWWITLAQSSSWDQKLFAFHLGRYRNVAGASSVESDGGTATFGYLDSSLYSGAVTYVSVGSNAQYWQIPIGSISMQGTAISLGSSNMAAIDTGTTLVGGPESIVASIYAAIPGSKRMTGSYAAYYEYPCSTSVNFEITFGGFNIKVTDQDFNLGKYSSDTSMCTGAAYVQSLSSSSPVQWIVGDAVLKNTYTVFRYSPAAVGFANLAGEITSSEAAQSTTIVDATSLFVSPTSAISGASTSASGSATTTSRAASASGSSTTTMTSSSSNAASSVSTVDAGPIVVVTASGPEGSAAAASAASAATSSASSASAIKLTVPSLVAGWTSLAILFGMAKVIL
ncbi:hypothetical protein IAR55_005258 [Kwoniella newhampshirensis]|uniref:Peptidase A1 domain-containing protein n=1 Tax=Kwoniella newhampshirensis TaxID=1651941 RepID=A0AAW0YVX7_9TREE